MVWSAQMTFILRACLAPYDKIFTRQSQCALVRAWTTNNACICMPMRAYGREIRCPSCMQCPPNAYFDLISLFPLSLSSSPFAFAFCFPLSLLLLPPLFSLSSPSPSPSFSPFALSLPLFSPLCPCFFFSLLCPFSSSRVLFPLSLPLPFSLTRAWCSSFPLFELFVVVEIENKHYRILTYTRREREEMEKQNKGKVHRDKSEMIRKWR
uniref:Uncharacterized protein n=1 Tax=Cacopsylla melanoneura TaxID=428564 RepID=A0A8D9E8W1_9HEMI